MTLPRGKYTRDKFHVFYLFLKALKALWSIPNDQEVLTDYDPMHLMHMNLLLHHIWLLDNVMQQTRVTPNSVYQRSNKSEAAFVNLFLYYEWVTVIY